MESFKLWLSDDEFFGLLEAIDHLEAMAFSTDPVFNRLLGMTFPGPQGRGWTKYIMSIVSKVRGLAGANLEEVATDVISGIVTDLSNGGTLAQTVANARQTSKDEAELLSNLRGIIFNAARMRTTDFTRRLKKQNTRFSPISQFDKIDRTAVQRQQHDVPDHSEGPTNNRDLASYEHMLAIELEKMQKDAVGRRETKLAKRLELARKVLPDRLAGTKMAEIMQKYGFTSKGTVQAIFDDISQALARVAAKLDDPVLMQGTARQGFGSNLAQGG